MAHPRHDQVRRRFGHRCGYCGVAEADAAGELTVDHFQPRSAGGDDSDDNLVYACFRCNLHKADFHPTTGDLALGHRLLHPLRDKHAEHYQLNLKTGELEPLTHTGQFHINLLHLNRPALAAYRLRQQQSMLYGIQKALLEEEIVRLRRLLVAQEQYLNELRRILDLPSS